MTMLTATADNIAVAIKRTTRRIITEFQPARGDKGGAADRGRRVSNRSAISALYLGAVIPSSGCPYRQSIVPVRPMALERRMRYMDIGNLVPRT